MTREEKYRIIDIVATAGTTIEKTISNALTYLNSMPETDEVTQESFSKLLATVERLTAELADSEKKIDGLVDMVNQLDDECALCAYRNDGKDCEYRECRDGYLAALGWTKEDAE